jgi:hypothetical protein
MFPCPVSMVVRYPVGVNFLLSRPSMSGKESLVMLPLVVCVQLSCHFLTVFSSSCLSTTLFGIFA